MEILMEMFINFLSYILFFTSLKCFRNIRRGLIFPWSVLDYRRRSKPRFMDNMIFFKTFYYVLFYIKCTIVTILLWPLLIRRIKCSGKKKQTFLIILFYVLYVLWCPITFITLLLMVIMKLLQIFVFLLLMRIVFLCLFEVSYRKNKKLLFIQNTKQELLDFKGDNMHKPEKSLLTYKESYQYGETYTKFTIPIFCSSPAVELNYNIFEINKINSYEKGKEKIIELLGDDFFELLDIVNKNESDNASINKLKKESTLIYTLIKRLDYNYIFLYFISDFLKRFVKATSNLELKNKAYQLIQNYIENDLYKIRLIFKEKDTLLICYRYLILKEEEIKEEFFKTVFSYDLFFGNFKRKYYFNSSDGKIDFTHPFLPIFFFNSNYYNSSDSFSDFNCVDKISNSNSSDNIDYYIKETLDEYFPKFTNTIITDNNVLCKLIVFCY